MIPTDSLDCNPEEKNNALPNKDTITPNTCHLVGISLSQAAAPIMIKSGDKLIKKETVVAGKYFSPQNNAPFPTVYALMPIANSRNQSVLDMGCLVVPFRNRNGSRIKKARKYRKPAMVSGPMYSKPIFTNTNEDAQIAVVKILSPMATILCVSLDDFATISKVMVFEDNRLTLWLTGGAKLQDSLILLHEILPNHACLHGDSPVRVQSAGRMSSCSPSRHRTRLYP